VARVTGSWCEVNIGPARPATAEQDLLLDVAAPLVREVLAAHLAGWFFSWENEPIGRPHLRLRLRWYPGAAGADRPDLLPLLARVLDGAEDTGRAAFWYPGGHGIPGASYDGEAGEYGGLWPLVAANWQAGCELALAVAAAEPDGGPTQLRYDQWSRRTHMFANALRLGYFREGAWCLYQGAAYLEIARDAGDPRAADASAAVDQAAEAAARLGARRR